MRLTTTVYESINECSDAWALVAEGGAPEAQVGWRLADEGRIASLQRYLIFAEAGEPVGGLVCALVRGDERNNSYNIELRAQAEHTDADVGRLLPGLVSAATRTSSGLTLRRGLTPGVRDGVCSTALEEFHNAADRLGTKSTAFMGISAQDDSSLLPALRRAGYRLVASEDVAVLRLPGVDFDDYVRGLSPNGSNNLRKEESRFLRAGCSIVMGDASNLTEAHAMLLLQHYQKFGHDADLPAVKDRLNRFSFMVPLRLATALDASGSVLGFAAYSHNGTHAVARFSAFRENRVAAYFNTLFYALIRDAYAHALVSIDYGTGTRTAKSRRGCLFSQRAILARCR